MKKVILIPDSFKETLSSKEICDVMKEKINKHFHKCDVISIPVADGGDVVAGAMVLIMMLKKHMI